MIILCSVLNVPVQVLGGCSCCGPSTCASIMGASWPAAGGPEAGPTAAEESTYCREEQR